MKQLNRFGEMIFRGQAMNFRGFGELAYNAKAMFSANLKNENYGIRTKEN
jgi:hypothetical protein